MDGRLVCMGSIHICILTLASSDSTLGCCSALFTSWATVVAAADSCSSSRVYDVDLETPDDDGGASDGREEDADDCGGGGGGCVWGRNDVIQDYYVL